MNYMKKFIRLIVFISFFVFCYKIYFDISNNSFGKMGRKYEKVGRRG